jgi:transposase-like protein
MKKNASKGKRNQEANAPGQRPLRLSAIIRRNLYAFVIDEGMKALDELLERDRELVCGPTHHKRGDHEAQRWGYTQGRLAMGGQRVTVKKPRARRNGEEVALPSWEQFADEDPLNERTLQQMLIGVSTRDYSRSVEPVPEKHNPHGSSRSAASRRFVAKTKEKLEDWTTRDIGELGIVAVMLDGIELGEHTVIMALGVDGSGGKHPLGMWLGATENAVVCGKLIDELIDRGLDAQRCYLFVIDGGKALRKAIRDRFKHRALIQRCQVHKLRNLRGHLPKKLHASVCKQMSDAYNGKSKKVAKERLVKLAQFLDDEHPDAAKSLREGLDETLTLKDLGLPDVLERTLSTTNAIENLNSTLRRITGRVKRWRDGKMVKRWVAGAVLEAQRGFRRLRGCKGMHILVAALQAHAEQIDRVDGEEKAA